MGAGRERHSNGCPTMSDEEESLPLTSEEMGLAKQVLAKIDPKTRSSVTFAVLTQVLRENNCDVGETIEASRVEMLAGSTGPWGASSN